MNHDELGAPSAASPTVLVGAAVPALIAVSATRSVSAWLRISVGDDEHAQPWTHTLTAAVTAAAGSVAGLALPAAPPFHRALSQTAR